MSLSPMPTEDPNSTVESQEDSLLDELDFRPRILGNVPKPDVSATYVRDLTEADMAALNGPRGSSPPRLVQKMRSSHHALARCLASGMKAVQASAVTGYTQNRISILQQDPTFQALVTDYRVEAKEIFADLTERMTNLSSMRSRNSTNASPMPQGVLHRNALGRGQSLCRSHRSWPRPGGQVDRFTVYDRPATGRKL